MQFVIDWMDGKHQDGVRANAMWHELCSELRGQPTYSMSPLEYMRARALLMEQIRCRRLHGLAH